MEPQMYFVLDQTKSNKSGLLVWWKTDGYGYTTKLDKAGTFLATKIPHRHGILAIPCGQALAMSHPVVETHQLTKLLLSKA